MKIRTVVRLMEIVLVLFSIVYSATVTDRVIKAEKRLSYLEGRKSVYEEFAEEDPRKLSKW